jgi:aspartate aminotransferase
MQVLEEANVAIVFGAAFGLSPCFRVSYAASEDTLKTACTRIAEFCAALT